MSVQVQTNLNGTRRYVVMVKHNRKTKYIASFRSENEARVASELHGEALAPWLANKVLKQSWKKPIQL